MSQKSGEVGFRVGEMDSLVRTLARQAFGPEFKSPVFTGKAGHNSDIHKPSTV